LDISLKTTQMFVKFVILLVELVTLDLDPLLENVPPITVATTVTTDKNVPQLSLDVFMLKPFVTKKLLS